MPTQVIRSPPAINNGPQKSPLARHFNRGALNLVIGRVPRFYDERLNVGWTACPSREVAIARHFLRRDRRFSVRPIATFLSEHLDGPEVHPTKNQGKLLECLERIQRFTSPRERELVEIGRRAAGCVDADHGVANRTVGGDRSVHAFGNQISERARV